MNISICSYIRNSKQIGTWITHIRFTMIILDNPRIKTKGKVLSKGINVMK